jgi:hypothetical protein
MRRLAGSILFVSSLGFLGLAQAVPVAAATKPLVTLTFDELPTQPVNGLSFRGVTFGFEVAGAGSTDARYNGGGPSAATVAEVPCLEGNAAGELTLRFDKPTNILRFGVVLSREGTFTPGFSVELFSPGGRSRGITDVKTTPTPVSRFGWSEGKFDYQGAAVGTAVITFNSSFDPEFGSRFALDNLTFKRIK